MLIEAPLLRAAAAFVLPFAVGSGLALASAVRLRAAGVLRSAADFALAAPGFLRVAMFPPSYADSLVGNGRRPSSPPHCVRSPSQHHFTERRKYSQTSVDWAPAATALAAGSNCLSDPELTRAQLADLIRGDSGS